MKALRTLVTAGTGALAYAVWERHRYGLTAREVPVARTAPALDVLHISDTHLTGRNRRLTEWLRSLPEALDEPPDLVLATGDLVEDDAGIEPLITELGRLHAGLGCYYVLGSHDYYQSTLKGHFKYLTGRREQARARPAATEVLESALRSLGWVSLTNRTEVVNARHGRIRLSGVDDPYLRRHRTTHLGRGHDDALAVGLVHAPAPAVVSEYALAGYDLILAGHTHGGQVRLPVAGALVTNCGLPSGLAAGLHRVGSGWLHVSPGLGTGRYSPIRFNSPPEATLLRLTPSG
jgi:predicted MPP superfamily phosphohydrolase